MEPTTTDADPVASAESVIDEAVELVRDWLATAENLETRATRRTMGRLEGVVADPAGVGFVMGFVDRVVRPDDDRVAAAQLTSLVSAALAGRGGLPRFLSPLDRMLLRAGAVVGPRLPSVVIPLARRRMRSIVGHLVAPADSNGLARHLERQHRGGWESNVNLLGEAVLGEDEASRRLQHLLTLVDQPDVDYVSVKITAVASQLNHWDHEGSLRRIEERLAELFDRAAAARPVTFINVDMEEYHDLELTLDAFMNVLDARSRLQQEAGIVLQTYLPDALPALQRLAGWANDRVASGGGPIKVRLVKGANLAMERVDAAMHGWEQAPFDTKAETDANFVRCVDWLLRPERMAGLRLGLASHNLFHVAWTRLLSERRGVADRVQFEMLQGMAEAQAAAVAETVGDSSPGRRAQGGDSSPGRRAQGGNSSPGRRAPLLYTPAVDDDDFDVAIGYLFRRLEENASNDNFLRHLFDLQPDGAAFSGQADRFVRSVRDRETAAIGPRRGQDRRRPSDGAYGIGEPFRNEPDTDPSLPANRAWLSSLQAVPVHAVVTPLTTSVGDVDEVYARARAATEEWAAMPPAERQILLHRVGDELAARRDELLRTMATEAGKTVAQADVELAEAIDFARYYGDRAIELTRPGLSFDPFGVVAVVPPWNFPVAIPAGGVLAALAAGNAVVFKPAPETARCAELVAESCWKAGVPEQVLQFVRTPDDEVGQRLVTSADAVVLTGSTETAELFRSWRPDMRLFAETSGKNALVVTPNADIDQAVADLVASAFGHAGQKCSAASLAVLVGDLGSSDRFRRQLVDAVRSLDVGPAARFGSTVGPLIGPPNPRLAKAFALGSESMVGSARHAAGDGTDGPGEGRWLVRPEPIDADAGLWRPGVLDDVAPGSWFHRTECFGPVLGLMSAGDLDEAIEIQNSGEFGLTGGIHSLDPIEIERWVERVEIGNAYVNRAITGAVVQRQPFGGWKRSSVGPGAKAGGPNYVSQLGTWRPDGGDATADYAARWADHFTVDHDPTALFCEANVFRYRPLSRIGLRAGERAARSDVELFRNAAAVAGVEVVQVPERELSDADLVARLRSIGVPRIRLIGAEPSRELRLAAAAAGVHLADSPVVADGRIELLHLVREQAVSRTLHRFGNLTADVIGQT